MADVAAVFHWPPESMDRMTIGELMAWRTRAVDLFAKMNGKG